MTTIQTSTTDLLLIGRMREMVRNRKVAEIRQAAGLTQAEIAGALGASRETICKWEAGARTPRGVRALRYAYLLDVLEKQAA